MVYRSYTHPQDLFVAADGGTAFFWTCVRTRPRWEKKFAEWLRRRGTPHFLPLVPKRTCNARKVRTSLIPLFAGHVFLKGDYGKADFTDSGCVAYLLKPGCVAEAAEFNRQIRGVWTSLSEGKNPWREEQFEPGDNVRILSGPMKDVVGRIVRRVNADRFVVWIEMLGAGVSVDVPEDAGFAKVCSEDHATVSA